MIDATVVMVDPSTVAEEEVVPGESRPLRAVLRAGGEELGRAHRPPAGDAALGARRPGPARAVRERDGGRDPERPAVRAGRGARTASCSSSTPPRTTSCAASATTSRRPLTSIRAYAEQLERRPAGPPPRDHRRAVRAAVADGPPAADRHPARVGRAPAAQRGRRRWRTRVRKAWEALGVDDVPFDARRRARPAGSPSPTPTSSTRSCGRSSTTP